MEADSTDPNDPDARPSLDEVLALRADRIALVRETLAGLTETVLAGDTDPITGPGYPMAGTYSVSRCPRAVLNEERCTGCSRSATSTSSRRALLGLAV